MAGGRCLLRRKGQRASLDLEAEDEELDILHDRLSNEIARGEMPMLVAAQVTLVSRFYERIGRSRGEFSPRIVGTSVLTGVYPYPAKWGITPARWPREELTDSCLCRQSRAVSSEIRPSVIPR